MTPDPRTLPARNVLLLSGGLDSVTVLYHLLRQLDIRPTLLYIDTGSRQSRMERKACRYFAALHDLPLWCEPAPYPKRACALLDNRRVLYTVVDGEPDLGSSLHLKPWVVPYRNLFLLTAAAIRSAGPRPWVLWTGYDGAPGMKDNTPEFLSAAANVLRESDDYCSFQGIMSPFGSNTKEATYQAALDMGVPVEKTYSCYNGFEVPCGICSACWTGKAAAEKLGVPDRRSYMTLAQLKRHFYVRTLRKAGVL